MASPAELASGASTAAASPTLSNPATVTRGDIVGPARRNTLNNVELPPVKATSLKFPSNMGPHYMSIGVSNSKRTTSISLLNKFVNTITDTESFIFLPLPENIKDATRVNYSTSPVVGGANALNAIGAGISSAFGGNQNTQNQNPFSAAISKLADPFFNDIVAQSGITPNQMLTVLLQGPEYKTHSFTWKLYPKNSAESRVIQAIILKLKSKSRPGSDPLRQFFTFPSLFNLSFVVNGKSLTGESDTNNYLFAFKPAVLTDMSVNYTPSGVPALYKNIGAPDGVELTLNFKEVEYWLNDQGFDEVLSGLGDVGIQGATLGEGVDAINSFLTTSTSVATSAASALIPSITP